MRICKLMLVPVLLSYSCFLPISLATTATRVSEIEWSNVASQELPAGCRLGQDEQHGATLVVVQSAPGEAETNAAVTLAVIEQPKLATQTYRLRGQVRYKNVEQAGYLELLNHFEGSKPGPYFTRTLATSGPMSQLVGESEWREFELPFRSNGTPPIKLELNVMLPGGGEVEFSKLSLEETSPSPWFVWPILAVSIAVLFVFVGLQQARKVGQAAASPSPTVGS